MIRQLRKTVLSSVAMILVAHGAFGADARTNRVQVALPAQPLRTSLATFAAQTGLQIMQREEDASADGAMAPAVEGELSVKEVLDRLLANSGLRYEFVNEGTVRISAADKTTGLREGKDNLRVARADADQTLKPVDGKGEEDRKVELEEIVVTGTHIRGAQPLSRLSTYTRKDFALAGLTSLKDFFRTLPQNFSTSSEATISAVAGLGADGNNVDANGINLRGFGTDATLVLLNGHRIAPGNVQGNIVDISAIPMSAVERIEVISDGASAIYGSDAVGGVVNIILRDDPGIETMARYASDTHSDRKQYQLGQSIGTNWGSGSVLASYEFDKQTALDAGDRSFVDDALAPFTLLPESKRSSVFLAAQQAFGDGWRLSADGLYSNRKGFNSVTVANSFSQETTYDIDTYSSSLGATKALNDSAGVQLDGSYSRSSTANRALYDPGNTGQSSIVSFDRRTVTQTLSAGAKLDGSLSLWFKDKVRYAFGAQFRRETFLARDLLGSGGSYSPSRNISAAFAELRLPLLSANDSNAAPPSLELSLADRYEHYNDFGNTNNPEIGVIWRPQERFRAHASYSTSFVAPTLYNLNPTPGTILGISSSYNAQFGLYGSNPPNVIIAQGGNPELGAQKSKNWSVGIEWTKLGPQGLEAFLNYFRLSYRDQIRSIDDLGFNTIIFSEEILTADRILGPEIINHNPSPARIQQFMNEPTYLGFGGDFSAAAGTLLIDARQQNLAVSKTDGVDFGLSYATELAFSALQVGVDGTYIFNFDNQVSQLAPKVSFLNLPYNPIDLKVRAKMSIERHGMTAAVFLNYIDSYHSDNAGQELPVASWTTIDMNVSYEFRDTNALFEGTVLSIGADNIFNRSPPFVLNHAGFPLNYDGVNSNPLGRFMHLQVTRRWQ